MLAPLAPLALGAGLLAGEAALGAVAYLFAFALLLDPLTRQPWAPRRRLLTLWPYACCVVLWRLVYQRLGCGAFGSGAYLDPVREPLTFAAAAAQRTPLLLAGQLGRPPPDLATFLPATTAPMLALALLLLLGVALALRPLWRRPLTRFFTLGGALAVLPCCATFPSDRLLLLVGLGGFGLCAQLLTAPPAGWSARALCLFLLLAHGVAAPPLLPPRCLSVRALGQVSGRASVALPRDERPLVLVTAPDMLIPINILAQRAAEGGRCRASAGSWGSAPQR